MEMDPELQDTILHKSGYIIREAVEDAVARIRQRESSVTVNAAMHSIS